MGARRWPSDDPQGLSGRQQRFVEEYLVDLNIAAAARRAGYSPGTTSVQTQLMKKPQVRAAVDAALAARAERTRVDADRVIAELAKIAFANMLDFVTVDEAGAPHIDLTRLGREDGAAIQSITVDYHRPPGGGRFRREGQPSDLSAGASAKVEALAKQGVRRVRLTLGDKHAALITLAKHLGLMRHDAASDIPAIIQVITGVPRAGDPDVEMRRVGN